MWFNEISIDLPKIDQSTLPLTKPVAPTGYTTHTDLRHKLWSWYVKITSCNFHFFSFIGKHKERFDYFCDNKNNNNENSENRNQLAISKSLILCNRGLMWIYFCHPSPNIVILWCGWVGKYQDNYTFWIKNDWSWLCEYFTFKNPCIKKL